MCESLTSKECGQQYNTVSIVVFECSLDSVPARKYNDGSENHHMEQGAWGNFSRGAAIALQKKGYKLSQV